MDYSDLLAAAQQNPDGADFHSLRMAFTRTAEYAPYAHNAQILETLGAALREDDLTTALEAVGHMLDACYVDIEAHIAADFVHTKLGDQAKAAYHRLFARGLIRAALATGDGRTPETAIIVIDVPEEYVLLRVMGLRATLQALVQHEGHWLDRIDAEHTPTGQKTRVYFNIDLPKNWLDGHLTDRFGDHE